MKYILFALLLSAIAAGPPQVDELYCYTIGPYPAYGNVLHDSSTQLSQITWPYFVNATWPRDDQSYTFDDPYDFALRVELSYWPHSGGFTTQQVTVPKGYMIDPNRLDIISGGQSVGYNPQIDTQWTTGDILSMNVSLLDVVNDEFLFVIRPQTCDGDLNLDRTRNFPDLITCINEWGSPYGIPDLIAVINNFNDDCP